MGFNMNSYTGASFSRNAVVCYGASSEDCAGVEVGQGFAWDRSGGFNGMTVYAEAYATFSGVRVSTGYEHGFFGAAGRGLYAGIGGYGLHGQVAQNGGASWGFSKQFDIANYIRSSHGHYASVLGGLYEDFDMKLPADGYYADDWALINIAQHLLNY